MKKRVPVFISIILIIAVVILIIVINTPYKQTAFVVDGDNFTAEVMDDGALVLNVFDDEEDGEWCVASTPEMYVSDYYNETENGTEFHIIPLSEGKGDMAIHYIKDDGTVDRYILTLSISRHKKKYVQIDAVSFMPYDIANVN